MNEVVGLKSWISKYGLIGDFPSEITRVLVHDYGITKVCFVIIVLQIMLIAMFTRLDGIMCYGYEIGWYYVLSLVLSVHIANMWIDVLFMC